MVKKNLKMFFIAVLFLITPFYLILAAEQAGVSDETGVSDSAKIEVAEEVKVPEKIVLSGKVVFDGYYGGEITVSANEKSTSYEGKNYGVLDSTVLDSPGFFFVSVPQNSGKVFLEAYIAKNTPSGLEYLAWGKYPLNPLTVGNVNLEGLNIKMSDNSVYHKMNDYQGEKVAIKGRVTFDNYKSGLISVNASSAKGKEPDINSVSIDSPGEYVMEVPANTGIIYITAVNGNQETRQSQKAIGGYEKPVEVGTADIEGVDIKMYEDVSATIDSLSTVTIKGKISVDNFSGEVIHVGVGRLDYERPNINFTDLSSPGEYVLKAPKNIGPVYVTSEVGAQRRSYKNNPIVVGDSDLQGIDIVF
ncbi:MAG: hypothetical protein PHO40_00360 [Candidatus Omnitrophica bacterium]|jgi:hypothetical protein|nr:hypothetical protein [Candidatus Omnitrophota bacterium]